MVTGQLGLQKHVTN